MLFLLCSIADVVSDYQYDTHEFNWWNYNHVFISVQAAKEFESELKKEPDSISEPPAAEPKAVSEEQKEDPVSSSKEST